MADIGHLDYHAQTLPVLDRDEQRAAFEQALRQFVRKPEQVQRAAQELDKWLTRDGLRLARLPE